VSSSPVLTTPRADSSGRARTSRGPATLDSSPTSVAAGADPAVPPLCAGLPTAALLRSPAERCFRSLCSGPYSSGGGGGALAAKTRLVQVGCHPGPVHGLGLCKSGRIRPLDKIHVRHAWPSCGGYSLGFRRIIVSLCSMFGQDVKGLIVCRVKSSC
jgi:hypothetical protein